jgi:hypothetical protein
MKTCLVLDGNELGPSSRFIDDGESVDFLYCRLARNVGVVETGIPWTNEVNMDFLPRLEFLMGR